MYLTQELGTLLYRIKKHKKIDNIIYIVGNEQRDHFNIFFEIVKKIKISGIGNLYHLSYNSVNYMGKKIKSRKKNNSNYIYIDYLIKKTNLLIKKFLYKKGIKSKKIEEMSLGSIKYEFLKNNPNKIIDFDINSIFNFKGNTGIYIQYTYARILSILKNNKAKNKVNSKKSNNKTIKNNEKILIKQIVDNKNILNKITYRCDISILINYIYIVSKTINNFYNCNKILKSKTNKKFRLKVCRVVLRFLSFNMKILGIPILKTI